MDRHLFDILWEVYRDVDGKQPIQIISSYRSPGTNAMLRHRSANSGVARFSQHMLGHAMDFYIPGVALADIRAAGLRLQRGGVGFYPTSGSPFVHLDTGSIRHWPRMTHDQLAKVFPDGRTVHVPTDGKPLKNYELAKADIEKRGEGDDAATVGKTSFLASLFKGKGKAKANDEEEEAAVEPAKPEPQKPAPVVVAAAKPAPAPAPRAKTSAIQLASADVQSVQPPKAQPALVVDRAEPKPQTPADIINARGFWDDSTTPKQATPAQVAALSARKALENADPQPTASVPQAYSALAYAPLSASPVDHSNIVAASAPIPRSARPARYAAAAATEINTIATKDMPGKGDAVTTAARLSAGKGNDIWIRIMMLAPSASRAMSVTVMGDSDMTAMRAFFVKPSSTITMGFTDDPLLGMSVDRFSGSATTKLETTSFTLRTAMLR
jgi:hypothetical protein